MNIPAPVVESVALDKLKPWPGNPKLHAADDIRKSIETFGYADPILVQKGTYRIIAGHGRLEALQKLGITEVPVIVLDMTDDQADLYTITSNKLVEKGGWDFASMADLLLDFDARNLDVRLTGFDDAELKRIAEWTPPNDKPETDEVPAPPAEAISKPGDIWQVGNHRLMCGDSTKSGDIAALMGGEKALLCLTDPPYGVSYADKNEFLNAQDKGNRIQDKIENDHMKPEAMMDFWKSVWTAWTPVLTEDATYYISGPSGTLLLSLLLSLRDAGWVYRHMLIWAKNNHVLGRCDYHYKHEPILYGWMKTHHFYGGSSCTSLLEIDRPHKSELHPTMKPVELFERLMSNSSKSGDAVADPFSGSGTTIIAAERLGRKARAMEIEPRYVDVAVRRWQNLTGMKAKNLTRPEVEIA